MNLMKHFTQQPFIVATGLAALIHSTWSLGTLFAGSEPVPQFSLAWFAWLTPALLIAFALDVGQIVTSAEIRFGQRKRAKYATFLTFALATYYLQWLYIAHHMPVVDLAAGVRESWAAAASTLRDAALWFIPALLPLSTALYTFSYSGKDEQPDAHTQPESFRNQPVSSAGPLTVFEQQSEQPARLTDQAERPALPESIAEPLAASDDTPLGMPVTLPLESLGEPAPLVKPYVFVCDDCGYTNSYATEVGKAQGKRAHDRHCAEKVRA